MKKIILSISITICTISLFAQEKVKTENVVFDKASKLQFAEINVIFSEKDSQALIENLFGKQENTNFKLERSYKDNMGYTHYVYQQYYLGLKVHGASIGFHQKDNTIKYVNANYATITDNSINAKLPTVDAIANALQYSKQKVYGKMMENPVAMFKEMVYTKNKENDFVLAHKIAVKSKSDLQYYYIDANSGELIVKEFTSCGNNVPGTGQTTYSGTRAFIGDQQSGSFRLRQLRNNVNITTWNNNFSSDETGAVATDFWDNDNNWTIAEHPNDRVALDVHWAMQNVFDYWRTVHNRNSIDNNGIAINSYVHYFDGDPNNAHWNRTNNSMYFGDGDGISFNHFGSLDICGHELGHGICDYTANLIYSTDESGGLNEGFSDIWGATIANWTDPSKDFWHYGAENTLITPFFTRSFINPNQAPNNWQQPDTYLGTFWNNLGGDPHIRSGVLNKWYYILSVGETGTNDLGNVYSVLGIGIASAARIAYATEQNLLSGDGYLQARNISIQQARIIFGTGSCEERAVRNAWYAVGIGQNVATIITILGDDVICTPSASSVYTLSNISCSVVNTTWSISCSWSGPQATLSSATGNSTTVILPSSMPASGTIVLTATIAGNPTPITKTITYGLPTFGASYHNGVTAGNPVGIYFQVTHLVASLTPFAFLAQVAPI